MRVAFPISGGLVDLEAAGLLREGQVVTLSTAEIRVISSLYARQRRLVDLAELARESGVGRDSLDDLRLLLRVLERRLGAAAGLRPVLRLRGEDQAGLWPQRGEVPRTHGAVLVAIGLDARRQAFREAPETTETRWVEERARWIRAAPELNGLPFEEGAGALVLLFPESRGVLAWIDRTLGAAPAVAAASTGGDVDAPSGIGPRLRIAVEVARWPDRLGPRALEVALARLSRIWEHTSRGMVTLSERALRACDDGRSFRPVGRLPFEGGGRPEIICAVRGDAPLLPSAPEPLLPSPPVLPRSLDLRDAVLAALDGGSRLVVLHGPSGLGKTDLAIQIAGIVQRSLRGRGGARFVRLGDGPDDLAEQVAGQLGLLGFDDPVAEVGRALRELGDTLLVLDGFERSDPQAVTWVTRWRDEAPRCALLLTAPDPLRVAGAVNVSVEPWAPRAGADVLRRTLARRGVILVDGPELDDQLGRIVTTVTGAALGVVVAASLIATDGVPEALAALERAVAAARGDALSAALRLARSRLSEPLQRGLDRLAVLRGDFDVTVASGLLTDCGSVCDALMQLVDSGLLRARADAVLGEPRFSLPGPVLRVLDVQLPRAERQRLRERALRDLAARVAGWASELDAGGDERQPLRRIELHRSEMLEILPRLRDPQVVDGVVAGMLRLASLGRVELGRLARAVAAAPATPNVGLARARALMLQGQPAAAAEQAAALVVSPSPVGELATVLHLAASRGELPYTQARATLIGVLRRWEEMPDKRYLPASGAVLDALLSHELIGDASMLADDLARVAAAHGSVWRRAVIAVHGFRARALLARCGDHDDAALVIAVLTLQELGDHRAACLGLQWLSRRLVAVGRAERAVKLLARVQSYLDVYASPTLRPVLALDRARALALSGEPDVAQALLRELCTGGATSVKLPAVVCAIDGALAALIGRDRQGAAAWLDTVDPLAAPASYAAILGQLHRIVAVELPGAPAPPPVVAGDDAVLDALADGWGRPIPLCRAVDRARRHAAFRAIGLRGVLLRALVRAAEVRLTC